MSCVSILKTERYDPALLDNVVAEHFRLAEVEAQLRPGLRVTLKPNLLMRRAPTEATTTHPEVVAAVARWFKARGITDLIIADSPGGPYTRAALGLVYSGTGMTAMAEREGIPLNLDVDWKELPAKGTRVTSFHVINPLAETDLIVNLCKLKTHGMTGLSGAVKNLFGSIPGLQKPELHYRFKDPDVFCEMLCDLCETVHPAVTLVDAVVAMEGDGPSGGSPVETGLTLCSTHPYDLDQILCELIGMNPDQAGTVKAGAKRGLNSPRESITLLGEPELLRSVRPFQLPSTKSVDFTGYIPRFLHRLVDRIAVPRPVIRVADCIGCGKCAESCPAHTIVLRERKAVIDYQACIKCYCCHEMCPVRAIDVRRNRLFDL